MARTKGYKGIAMEGAIASWYNRYATRNRGFDAIAAAVVSRLAPGGAVLEVAPGPGRLAIEIAKRGVARVAGLDISESFVRIARENARCEGVAIEFTRGDAAHMPYPDASFDAVVCVAAFKNFADPVGAIDEMFRVLRPGGTASIFDLRKDASMADIADEVAGMQLSALNAFFTRLTFRHLLLRRAYTVAEVERMAAQSRFGRGQLFAERIGFELRLTR